MNDERIGRVAMILVSRCPLGGGRDGAGKGVAASCRVVARVERDCAWGAA